MESFIFLVEIAGGVLMSYTIVLWIILAIAAIELLVVLLRRWVRVERRNVKADIKAWVRGGPDNGSNNA